MSLTVIFGSKYVSADQNLQALALYKRVLFAANRLSAERGPTNGVLGEAPSVDSPSRLRLAEFRTMSDASLDALAAPEAEGMAQTFVSVDQQAVAKVRERLRTARTAIDRLASLPRVERSGDDIDAAIHGMFDVVETLRPVLADVISQIVVQDQSLAGSALMGEMLADLREYVGRFAAYLMTSIATHQPLSSSTLDEVNRIRGRIFELWQLTQDQFGFYANDPQLVSAIRDIKQIYFGKGLKIVEKTIEEGRRGGAYSMTTAELTDAYVPTFAPIERMRTAFLDMTFEKSRASRDRALYWLIGVSAITGLIVLANVVIIVSARRLVFRPLLTACNHIIALSEGREIDETLNVKEANEMRRLFDALSVLRVQLRERRDLTVRLKVQAERDGLTGLLNRFAFDRLGQGSADDGGLPQAVGLILMDIDRFKVINDTHGHLVGDAVLKSVAALVSGHIGERDVAARYGGEEIAIVVSGGAMAEVAALAERIRAALERHTMALDRGSILVTASFGLATGRRGAEDWTRLIRAADDALYRAKAAGRNRVVEASDLPASRALAADPSLHAGPGTHRGTPRAA